MYPQTKVEDASSKIGDVSSKTEDVSTNIGDVSSKKMKPV